MVTRLFQFFLMLRYRHRCPLYLFYGKAVLSYHFILYFIMSFFPCVSAANYRVSAANYRVSAANYRVSAANYRVFAVNYPVLVNFYFTLNVRARFVRARYRVYYISL